MTKHVGRSWSLLALLVLAGCTVAIRDFPEANAALDANVREDAGRDANEDADEDAGTASPDRDPLDAPAAPDVEEPLDAGVLLPPQIPHLDRNDQTFGAGDLIFQDGFINTTDLTVPGMLPAGATFSIAPQSPDGPELAVLRVGTLTIPSGVRVRIVGPRPLVIVASGTIAINGSFDASAVLETPGAGGSGPGGGDGRGGAGASLNFSDSGGGGAGFGGNGAAGGFVENMAILGGAVGMEYGDREQTILIGGSGGGSGGAGGCSPTPGGAGGGAIQIYSAAGITIGAGGEIIASGGGGLGGFDCISLNAAAGNGGGSGGAIYLIAPSITNLGVLAANGGGGGGGATNGTGLSSGFSGGNGGSSQVPARGGRAGGVYGREGGDGATGIASPGAGVGVLLTGGPEGNAGGGGGGVGRIAIITATAGYSNTGTVSPAAFESTY